MQEAAARFFMCSREIRLARPTAPSAGRMRMPEVVLVTTAPAASAMVITLPIMGPPLTATQFSTVAPPARRMQSV